ncbi:MAG TPA: hypothetical protein VEF34_17230, partial [Syntrophobacteraceae bacterium]|nr:hypothetical protein [Syntrophobacteraceae bacterium]
SSLITSKSVQRTVTPPGPVEVWVWIAVLTSVTLQNPLRGQDMLMKQGRQARIIYECSCSKDLANMLISQNINV